MAERNEYYFVSDVHLGLGLNDPADREARFVSFLKGIPREKAAALFMLGDIWDFWYEYRDVVPRCGTRVIAALVDLMDSGVQVWFCPGNHDIWCYSYFESLGMRRFDQPFYTELGGKRFCLGHGDALGGAGRGYSFMLKVFHNKVLQKMFSTLHPWIAFRIGLGLSNSNRRTHEPYHFRGAEEPLYKFALSESGRRKVDYFVFGHFHDAVDLVLPTGSRLIVLKDWMDGGEPFGRFSPEGFELRAH